MEASKPPHWKEMYACRRETEEEKKKKQCNKKKQQQHHTGVQFTLCMSLRGIVIIWPSCLHKCRKRQSRQQGKGKRRSEPIFHIRGGLFAPSLSCA